MLLLAALVLCAVVVILMSATHCLLLDPADVGCTTKPWGQTVKDWLTDTIPVLVAIIMRGNRPPGLPPPPREPP